MMWLILAGLGALLFAGGSSAEHHSFSEWLRGKYLLDRGYDANSGVKMWELVSPQPYPAAEGAAKTVARAISLGSPVWIDKSGSVIEFAPMSKAEVMTKQGFILAVGPTVKLVP